MLRQSFRQSMRRLRVITSTTNANVESAATQPARQEEDGAKDPENTLIGAIALRQQQQPSTPPDYATVVVESRQSGSESLTPSLASRPPPPRPAPRLSMLAAAASAIEIETDATTTEEEASAVEESVLSDDLDSSVMRWVSFINIDTLDIYANFVTFQLGRVRHLEFVLHGRF